MAPEIFVQGPVEEVPDCHWNVNPVARVYPVSVRVNGVVELPLAGEILAVPAVGVPVHGEPLVPINGTTTGVTKPPPVIVTVPV